MPSARRLKTAAVILAVTICTIFYLTNDARRAASQEFYTNTVNALNAAEQAAVEKIPNLEAIKGAVKKGASPNREHGPAKPIRGQKQAPLEVAVPTKGLVDEKDDKTKKEDEEDKSKTAPGSSKKMKGGEKWDMATGKEAPPKDSQEEEKKETEEDHEVEVELNGILKKGPIIIFSKSYCRFSAKAKRILLEKYTIIPEPYVVELDQHPLGQALQAHLAKSTGRKTVPNILINGKSIGGGDEVAALDESGGLIEKVKAMGGKRVMEAKLAS